MQSSEYNAYDAYDYGGAADDQGLGVGGGEGEHLLLGGNAVGGSGDGQDAQGGLGGDDINLDDPKIAGLPRLLLMGPRRGGKTSIQVRLRV